MTEKQKYQDYPKNFEVKHDNGETIICHSGSENCQILTEVMPGYSPEENKLIIDTSIATLQPRGIFRTFCDNAPARTEGQAGVFVGQVVVQRCKATLTKLVL